MFLSAQIYFSVHKYIFQCTNVFFSAQICFSAQMYFSVHKNVSVHKYIFQCTNMFFSAQICFSAQISFPVHKIIPGTQWAKNGRRPWDYTVIEAWSRCLPRFRSVSSQIEAIFDRSSMFCRNCGKSLESSFAFCPNCGAKIEAETSLSSRDNIVGSASVMSQTSRKRASPSELAAPAAKQFPTFRRFLDRKSEERRSHFK